MMIFNIHLLIDGKFPKGDRLQNNCLGKILVRTCESLRTLLDFFDFLDFLVLVFCGLLWSFYGLFD